MKLFLIRHGRTPANSEKRLIGQKYDGDLCDFGIKQVKSLASKFINKQIDVIITSPLLRAKHSAEILQKAIDSNIQIIIDNALIEREYGQFEYCNKEELKEKKESMGIKFGDIVNYYLNSIGGTELRGDVFYRIQTSLDLARIRYGENAILAYITHGGVIYSFITESLRIPEEQERPFKICEASYLECNIDTHNIVEIIALWNNNIQ